MNLIVWMLKTIIKIVFIFIIFFHIQTKRTKDIPKSSVILGSICKNGLIWLNCVLVLSVLLFVKLLPWNQLQQQLKPEGKSENKPTPVQQPYVPKITTAKRKLLIHVEAPALFKNTWQIHQEGESQFYTTCLVDFCSAGPTFPKQGTQCLPWGEAAPELPLTIGRRWIAG